MKNIGHWTLRYIFYRISLWIYEKRHPDHPWLTKDAIDFLDDYLIETDVGLEFGSGRSTVWFSSRVAHMTSIEHNLHWFNRVNKFLIERKIGNCKYLLCPVEEDDDLVFSEEMNPIYFQIIEEVKDNSLEFVLNDGLYRGVCAKLVLEKIKPGGILIIDNINWFLPSKTKSPASVPYNSAPISESWIKFQTAVDGWRRIWTSNGVFDTGIYFKPL